MLQRLPSQASDQLQRGRIDAARCSIISPAALYLLNLLYKLAIPDADRKCGPWEQRSPWHGNSKHLQSVQAT